MRGPLAARSRRSFPTPTTGGGCPPTFELGSVAMRPGGGIWLGALLDREHACVLHHDGRAWTIAKVWNHSHSGSSLRVSDVALGADGAVWAGLDGSGSDMPFLWRRGPNPDDTWEAIAPARLRADDDHGRILPVGTSDLLVVEERRVEEGQVRSGDLLLRVRIGGARAP